MRDVGKPYEKPTAAKLTPQQAQQNLLVLVNRDDVGVKPFLEMMFPEDGTARPQRLQE